MGKSQQFLNDAYEHLVNDVADMLSFTQKSPWELTVSELETFTKACNDIAGFTTRINTRTFWNYFRTKEYNPKDYYISVIAAVWLVLSKTVPKKEVQEFYEKSKRKSSVYWDRYVEEYDKRLKEKKNSFKSDNNFETPQIASNFKRETFITSFLTSIPNKKILLIEGVPGSGKTTLVCSLHDVLKRQNIYNKIYWKSIENNYSLETFVREIAESITIAAGSNLSRAMAFIKQLDANDGLLIIDNIDQADIETFEDFFAFLSKDQSKTRLIVINNQPGKLPIISAENSITVYGLSKYEASELLKEKGIEITQNNLEQLILNTEGLPFYLDLFINNKLTPQENKHVAIEHLISKQDSINLIDQMYSDLNPDTQKLLRLLCCLDQPFTIDQLDYFAKQIQLTEVTQIIIKLINHPLVTKINNEQYKLSSIVSDHFFSQTSLDEKNKFNTIIGLFIWPEIRFEKKRHYTIDELLLVQKSISYFQKGNNFRKSNGYLIKTLPHFKRHGLFQALLSTLTFEIKFNNYCSRWTYLHYTHSCFVTGKIEEAYRTIKICLGGAINWIQSKKIINSEDTTYFLKTLILFSEITANLVSYKSAQKVLETALSLFHITNLEWNLKSHAVSLLAWYNIKSGEYDLAKEINRSIVEDHFTMTQQALGVANTQLGIISFLEKNYSLSIIYLRKASECFKSHIDMRGYSWCHIYLALCSQESEPTREIDTIIKDVLEINHESNLYDQDYLNWLLYFENKTISEANCILLQKELKRVQEKEIQIRKNIDLSEVNGFVDNLISEMDVYSKIPFSLKQFTAPSRKVSFPAGSVINLSIIDKIKKDPFPFLEDLFLHDVHKVFSFHQNNKIISECLKIPEFMEKILNKYIRPNIDYLKSEKTNDSLKIHYARSLQYAGDFENSMKLLDSIQISNQDFHYFNIKGNCFRKLKKFKDSYENYQAALEIARTKHNRGIVYHNLALLIYQLNILTRYEEAKEYCINAIKERNRDRRFIQHPITTLFLLEVEAANEKNVVAVALEFRETYEIAESAYKSMVSQILNPIKKKKLSSV
jgi:tetratricopeptide (TPR) repeat protein/DNA polymerase III delta prime subunit